MSRRSSTTRRTRSTPKRRPFRARWSRVKLRSRGAFVVGFAALIALWSKSAFAEPAHEAPADTRDHILIVGVGGDGEFELGDGSLHPGANLMVEWDALEDWLELEVGASVLSANHGVEVPIDLLVKKPFRLTHWAEFMIGVGPEVVQVTGSNKATRLGGEVALDFMFWPWARHLGLWAEPAYDVIFHGGAASGIGATGGVLFGW
jgi:hypothetical protein